jgi:hypothetical protein
MNLPGLVFLAQHELPACGASADTTRRNGGATARLNRARLPL